MATSDSRCPGCGLAKDEHGDCPAYHAKREAMDAEFGDYPGAVEQIMDEWDWYHTHRHTAVYYAGE